MNLDFACRAIVDHINNDCKNSLRIYVCASGAGAGIQNYLWEVPGCSKYFIGAVFPYSTNEMDKFLNFKPEKYCSRQTAMEIAFESFYRAVDPNDLQSKNTNIGVGLTGVVASTREHKGGNRVFCSIVTNTETHLFTVELPMGVGFHARRNDGNISNFLALFGIGKVAGINFENDILQLAEEYNFKHEVIPNEEAVNLLLKYPSWSGDKRHEYKTCHKVIFPGAFNPPHEGHFEMSKEVAKNVGELTLFTVSVDNPHKPKLLVGDILRRSKMLQGQERIFTLGEPLYLDKAKNHKGKKFLIGSDALERLLDPVWGPNTKEVLDGFKECEIEFFVSERTLNDKEITLESIYQKYPLALEYKDLFTIVNTKINMSSTEIRNRKI